ncbi:restriction endonuclease [candidate division KSB1 bacterium]|nr:restriction endonuclease [candidate division KSB1 bacterium]
MTDLLLYRKRIARFQRRDLIRLWREIQKGDTPKWETGRAFEYLVLRAFELEGAEVRWPYSVRIEEAELEQIDGVIYSDGLAYLIECKDVAKPINVETIAKLRNQLLRRPAATVGCVFSRSGFTLPAVTLARYTAPQTILLWNSHDVEYGLKNKCMRRNLEAKYRYCVEQGFPSYNIREVRSL